MSKIVTVSLPDIGEGVVEGEVVEWLKKEGESLKQDEPVVVVMTDKATVELPAPYPGTLAKQHHKPGEIAIKDKPLYDIEVEKGEPKPDTILAAPATRQLAKELGVDIDQIEGTGPEGRVTDADVVNYHASGESKKEIAKSDDEQVPIVGIPHRMAERMTESKSVIPHFSFFDQLDATRVMQLRDNIRGRAETEGFKLTYMPFFIKALSKTLSDFPEVNASVEPGAKSLILHKHHHIGIASKTEEGLIVFVIRDVQEKSLEETIREYDRMTAKMREGQLVREDMIGSTVTISNFGPLGGVWATPIINYPESAILGIAKIRKSPVVRNDEIVIRPILNLSWSFDHRVIDGDLAAKVSHRFINLIENPAQLL
jgi:pyruvate dehydrogenase E2 component (dihydrolipoamide acetyltransferase)